MAAKPATGTTRPAAASAATAASDKSKKKKREKDHEAEEARKQRAYEEQQAAWRPITWAEYKPDLRWPPETASDDVDLAENIQQKTTHGKNTDDDEIKIVSPHGSLEFSLDQLVKKSAIWDGVETPHQLRKNAHEPKVKIAEHVERAARQCIYTRILQQQKRLGTLNGGDGRLKSNDEKILDAYAFAQDKLKTQLNDEKFFAAAASPPSFEASLMQDWQFIFKSPHLRPHAQQLFTQIIPLCVQACERIAARAEQDDLINPPCDKAYWNPVRSFAGYLMKHKKTGLVEAPTEPYDYHLYKFYMRNRDKTLVDEQPQMSEILGQDKNFVEEAKIVDDENQTAKSGVLSV